MPKKHLKHSNNKGKPATPSATTSSSSQPAQAQAQAARAATASATTTTPPSWPAFTPSLPVTTLSPTPHPSLPDTVVLVRNFFPRSLCRAYVSFLASLPLATTPGRPKRGEAVRVNDRYQVQDVGFALRLWLETGLREALMEDEDLRSLWGGEVVGLNPNIRIYRYSPGQFFAQHYDESNTVPCPSSEQDPSGSGSHTLVPSRTTWTLLLYLTSPADGCLGGETVFFPEVQPARGARGRAPPQPVEVAVGLETGLLLLHKHGDDCLLHEGREVTAGEKWVVRADLCVRR